MTICHCSEDRCHHDNIIEDDVITYADLIEDQEIAVELAMLASTPYSPRWGELIDQHGEAMLISLGAAI